MPFLYQRHFLSAGDTAIIHCDHECSVLLLDDDNFAKFRNGDPYRYRDGLSSRRPARLSAPTTGYWNIVLHSGGGSARIRHRVVIEKSAARVADAIRLEEGSLA